MIRSAEGGSEMAHYKKGRTRRRGQSDREEVIPPTKDMWQDRMTMARKG